MLVDMYYADNYLDMQSFVLFCKTYGVTPQYYNRSAVIVRTDDDKYVLRQIQRNHFKDSISVIREVQL